MGGEGHGHGLWINWNMYKAPFSFYVFADVQNPRSKLGPSSISLMHAYSVEVFLTLSIGLVVELDSAKAPSRHWVSASILTKPGYTKQWQQKCIIFKAAEAITNKFDKKWNS